jgi:hypothetical protein
MRGARRAVLARRTDAFMAIPLLGSQARVPRRCPRAGVTDRTLCSSRYASRCIAVRPRSATPRSSMSGQSGPNRPLLRHPTCGPTPALARDGYPAPRRCGGSSGGGTGLPDSRPPQPFRQRRNPSPSSLTWRSPHLCQPNLHKILSMRSSLRRESLGVDHVRESSTSMTRTVVRSHAHAIRDVPGSSSSSAAITRPAATGSSARMSPWGTSSSPSRRCPSLASCGGRASRSWLLEPSRAREAPAGPIPAQRGRTLGGLGARTSRAGSKAARPEQLSRRALVAWRSAGVERGCLVHADSPECDR